MQNIQSLKRIGRVSFNIERLKFYVIIVSLLLFNENVRLIMFHNYYNILRNGIYLNILFLIFGGNILIKYILKKRINKIIIFLSILFMLLTLTNMFFNHVAIATIILCFTCIIFPLIFMSIKMNMIHIKKIFDAFLNILNIIIAFLLIYGITDYLLKGQLQLFLAYNWLPEEMQHLILLEHSWGIYRMYSFIGHPLTNAYYFLMFYCFNCINNKYFQPKINTNLLIIASLLGLLLSGSKTAMIIALFLMIFDNNKTKHKWVYYIMLTLFVLIFINTSIFQENLMKRFMQSINSGDISSGRNILIKALLSNSTMRPDLILGGGTGYSIVVSKGLLGNIYNFEYPIIMLAFDYGIIETIIIYIIILVYPMSVFIKNRSYIIMLNFLGMFSFVNTNNGLANLSDSVGVLCFTTIIIMGLSNYVKKINSA